MARSRFQNIFSKIVDIKPGERKIAILLFFYFFSILFPFWIVKSVRDEKFLIEEGSLKLPFAYLLTALIMGFIVAFHSRLQVKLQKRILTVLSLTFFVLTSFIFGLLFMEGWGWVPYVYWLWANIFGIVLVTQFFLLVNEIFNPREGRRLIGFLGSGGTLGGILGALTAGLLARIVPEIKDYVLFIAGGVLVSSIFILNYIFHWRSKKGRDREIPEKKRRQKASGSKVRVGFFDSFLIVKNSYYLRLIAGIVIFTIIVSTFIDWQQKSVIEFRIDKDDYLTFFGFFNSGLLLLAFLIQLLFTSRFIQRFGIKFSLLFFPLILLGCSLGIVFSTGVLFAILIKGSDKSLSFSLNQSVRELLYIPLPSGVKDKAKVFIDMFLNRFAKGLGAVILMIFLLPSVRIFISGLREGVFPHLADWQLRIVIVSIFSVVSIIAWGILNLKVSREYTNTVKKKLEIKWDRADKMVAEKLDLDYTKLVFDTLESKERSSVLFALHLFDLMTKGKLTPEVQKLISYRPEKIKPSSFVDIFDVEDSTFIPSAEEHLSEEVLDKEVKEIMSLGVYKEVMKQHFDKVLADASDKAETARMEIAKAIGFMEADSPLVDKIEELIRDESPGVVRFALESAARLKKREYVPLIVDQLKSPLTRGDASSALLKYGERIVGTLGDYLADTDEKVELRKAVASVLARISNQDAARFLLFELSEKDEGLDRDVIDALDNIRAENPGFKFSFDVVEKKILMEIKKYCRLFIELDEAGARGEEDAMIKSREKRLAELLSNIFLLLGLVYPREDVLKAYQNVRVGTRDSVAYAVELLDNMVKKELKLCLLPLVEEMEKEERIKRFRELMETMPRR